MGPSRQASGLTLQTRHPVFAGRLGLFVEAIATAKSGVGLAKTSKEVRSEAEPSAFARIFGYIRLWRSELCEGRRTAGQTRDSRVAAVMINGRAGLSRTWPRSGVRALEQAKHRHHAVQDR